MKEKKKSNFADKMRSNLKKQKEARKSFGYLNLPNGVKTISMEEGTRKLKIDFVLYKVTDEKHPESIPDEGIAVPGSGWWRRPFFVHREVGSGRDTVVCPTSFGKPCPICEYRGRRIKDGAPKEEYKLLYPKPRSLYVGIPLGLEGHDEVPHIWDMSDRLFLDILKETLEEEEENVGFPSLEDGKTLTLSIKWETIGKGKPYPEVRHITFEDREPYGEEIMDEAPNLDEVLKVLSYKEIKEKFFEVSEEDVEEEEVEDDTPVVTTRATRRTPKPVEKVEEEEETVEEEEETPPPARTRTRPTPTTTTSASKDPCPKGHKFGTDFEKFSDCDTCDKWDECMDEHKKKK